MIDNYDFAVLLAMHWLVPNNKTVSAEVLKRVMDVDVGNYKSHILKPVVVAYIPTSVYDNMAILHDMATAAVHNIEILLETYDGKVLGIYDHQPDPKTKREFILSQSLHSLTELSRYIGIDQQATREEYELIKNNMI
jgi:hypothetical protein